MKIRDLSIKIDKTKDKTKGETKGETKDDMRKEVEVMYIHESSSKMTHVKSKNRQ